MSKEEKQISSDKRYNSILKIIDKHLVPDEVAKKDRGEVFTPPTLVREMLFGLRKSALEKGKNEIWGINENGDFFDDKESDKVGGVPLDIWRNPNIKWLDPANGIGNFPVIAYYMLDYQLDEHGKEAKYRGDKNKDKRRKHIIENMLYMIELDKGNCATSRSIFKKIDPEAKANICCTNTLSLTDEKIKSKFGIDRFDVVMGNPPFQDLQEAEGKRGGGDELYMKFVKKSLELLKDSGYLVFLHPPSWRKPEYNEGRKKSKNAGMFNLIAHNNHIVYLEIHSSKDGMDIFKAGTRYDFYTLKKTISTKNTIIKDINGEIAEIDLSEFDFLPNYNIKNIKKLLPAKSKTKCDLGIFDDETQKYTNNPCILYETSAYETRKYWVSNKETSQFKYPLVHTTPIDGVRYYYSNTKDKGMFGIPKVIFGDGGINEPIIDLTGKYGMTQHAMAIVIKNESDANKLSKFLKSNFFKNVLSACMWSSFQIDWRLFTYFKDRFWDIDVDLDEAIINIGSESTKKKRGTRKTKEPSPEQGGAKKPKNKTRKVKKFFGLF